MRSVLLAKAWSPYLVGAGIGVLSWFAFGSVDKPLGITTAFENSAALIGRGVGGDATNNHAYYVEPEHKVKIDWEWMLVAGVFIGALLSSWLSGDRTGVTLPPFWRRRFGHSTAKRIAAAFLAGAVMMFGARLAQGCTSGHGISGALQLAVSSWAFILLAFGVAVATAFLMYGKEGRQHV